MHMIIYASNLIFLTRYLFWSDFSTSSRSSSSKIERSSLTGENRMVVIGRALLRPLAIAVDVISRRIYFTNLVSMESVDYSGQNRKHLIAFPANLNDVAVFQVRCFLCRLYIHVHMNLFITGLIIERFRI